MRAKSLRWCRLPLLLGALLPLCAGGCLWVAAGAAGGAALTYAYCQGRVSQVYAASLDDAWAATRTALTELQMPILEESREKGSFKTRTSDGDTVRIHLDPEMSRIPADGPLTRVSVRVALFGDHPVSARVLDQIGAHLVPPGTVPAGPPGAWSGTPPVPPPPPPAGMLPPTTAPPPLLPPEPVTRTATRGKP